MNVDREHSEKELVKAAAGGDREAFAALARAAAPAVYSLAYRLTGNKADADDIAQETMVSAWRHLGTFECQCSFGSWVYRIAVNLWKNRVKYEKRRFFYDHFSLDANSRGDDEDGPSAPQIPDEGPDPLTAAERSNESERVQRMLSRLEPEERSMILLREIENKSYEEIAALLECPLGTVKSRIARAREALRRVWVECHEM